MTAFARRDLIRLTAGASLAALLPTPLRATPAMACGAPRLSAARIAPEDQVAVEIDVANASARPRDAFIRIYVHDHVASVARPPLKLASVVRVALRPGETRTLRATLGPGAFRLPSADGNGQVEPGLFDIMAGPDRDDLRSATLEIV